LSGRKFRRQHSVGNYILDFFCVEERLAVELDGQVHRNEQAELYDHRRTVFLNKKGIKVIRFENFLVFDDIDYIAARIETYFGWWREKSSTTPSAPPKDVGPATPPIQEGSLGAREKSSTTPSAPTKDVGTATPPIQEGSS
jgi:hypothetical protein